MKKEISLILTPILLIFFLLDLSLALAPPSNVNNLSEDSIPREHENLPLKSSSNQENSTWTTKAPIKKTESSTSSSFFFKAINSRQINTVKIFLKKNSPWLGSFKSLLALSLFLISILMSFQIIPSPTYGVALSLFFSLLLYLDVFLQFTSNRSVFLKKQSRSATDFFEINPQIKKYYSLIVILAIQISFMLIASFVLPIYFSIYSLNSFIPAFLISSILIAIIFCYIFAIIYIHIKNTKTSKTSSKLINKLVSFNKEGLKIPNLLRERSYLEEPIITFKEIQKYMGHPTYSSRRNHILIHLPAQEVLFKQQLSKNLETFFIHLKKFIHFMKKERHIDPRFFKVYDLTQSDKELSDSFLKTTSFPSLFEIMFDLLKSVETYPSSQETNELKKITVDTMSTFLQLLIIYDQWESLKSISESHLSSSNFNLYLGGNSLQNLSSKLDKLQKEIPLTNIPDKLLREKNFVTIPPYLQRSLHRFEQNRQKKEGELEEISKGLSLLTDNLITFESSAKELLANINALETPHSREYSAAALDMYEDLKRKINQILHPFQLGKYIASLNKYPLETSSQAHILIMSDLIKDKAPSISDASLDERMKNIGTLITHFSSLLKILNDHSPEKNIYQDSFKNLSNLARSLSNQEEKTLKKFNTFLDDFHIMSTIEDIFLTKYAYIKQAIQKATDSIKESLDLEEKVTVFKEKDLDITPIQKILESQA